MVLCLVEKDIVFKNLSPVLLAKKIDVDAQYVIMTPPICVNPCLYGFFARGTTNSYSAHFALEADCCLLGLPEMTLPGAEMAVGMNRVFG